MPPAPVPGVLPAAAARHVCQHLPVPHQRDLLPVKGGLCSASQQPPCILATHPRRPNKALGSGRRAEGGSPSRGPEAWRPRRDWPAAAPMAAAARALPPASSVGSGTLVPSGITRAAEPLASPRAALASRWSSHRLCASSMSSATSPMCPPSAARAW